MVWHLQLLRQFGTSFLFMYFGLEQKQSGALSFLGIVLFGQRPHGKAHIVNDQTTHTIANRQRIGRLDSRGHHCHVDGYGEMARP